jgi:hypothetical protein
MDSKVFACVAIVLGSLKAGTLYNFVSFDGPGDNGGGTTVNGINNNGDVVGFSSDVAGTPSLLTNFIRNPDGSFNILSLDGDPLAMANGINDARTVVGGFSFGVAFVLPNGGPALPVPVINGTTSQIAFGINDTNLSTGQYTDNATGTTPGYLLQGTVYTTLNPVAAALVTNAQGVNNLGEVVGFYSLDGVHQHGFFYNSTTKSFTLPADPNIPNLFLTQFLSINDNGLAVGYYQTEDGSQHGFLYNTLTGAYTFLDDPSAATSGVSITQITGINDSDEITGFYVDAATGLQRGFIANVVPEPATFGMMLAGSLVLISLRVTVRCAAVVFSVPLRFSKRSPKSGINRSECGERGCPNSRSRFTGRDYCSLSI